MTLINLSSDSTPYFTIYLVSGYALAISKIEIFDHNFESQTVEDSLPTISIIRPSEYLYQTDFHYS